MLCLHLDYEFCEVEQGFAALLFPVTSRIHIPFKPPITISYDATQRRTRSVLKVTDERDTRPYLYSRD